MGDEPDAETRRNALLALIEVCQTLGLGGGDNGGLSHAQLQRALATLLRSTGDYATDKRGDVGSWCRQVALRGLASLLALLGPADHDKTASASLQVGAAVRTAYGQGTVVDVRCEGRVAHVQFRPGQPGAHFFPYNDGTGVFPLAAVASVEEDPALATSANPTSPPAIGSETAEVAAAPAIDAPAFTAVVCAALQQLCEKLDVVRECAGAILLDLLALPAPPLPTLRDRALLEATLLPPAEQGSAAADSSSSSFYKAGSPSVVFPRVVRLLGTAVYHRPVVAGLAISVGGLTESVVKASLGAMVEWAQAQRQQPQQPGQEGAAAIARVGRTLLEVLDAHPEEDRVVLPLLRTVDLFVQKGVLLDEDLFNGGSEADELARGLLERVKRELQGCKDVKKLLACLSVAVHLLAPLSFAEGQEDCETGAGAMRLLMVLLGHRFPRVRKAAAEQLYTKLLLHDQLLKRGGADVQEKALECLGSTGWDTGDLAGVRQARDALCRLLVISPPATAASASASAASGVGGVVRKRQQEDELASYAALVKEMGY